MADTKTVFYSEAPEVVEWWHNLNEERDRLMSECGRLEEEFPGFRAVAVHGIPRFSLTLLGLEPVDDTDMSPEGRHWRVHRNINKREGRSVWIPDKRYAEGKEMKARFDQAAVKAVPVPGMPTTVHGQGKWFSPGVAFIEGRVWMTWGCSRDLINNDWSPEEFDEKLWTQAKLSEWYLTIEAEEERADAGVPK